MQSIYIPGHVNILNTISKFKISVVIRKKGEQHTNPEVFVW